MDGRMYGRTEVKAPAGAGTQRVQLMTWAGTSPSWKSLGGASGWEMWGPGPGGREGGPGRGRSLMLSETLEPVGAP